jgi:hypothetical protein
MMQNKTKILIGILAIVVLAGSIGFYFMYQNLQHKNEAIVQMSQQFDLEKEQLTDEYSQLNLQYEGYGLRVGNDSLAQLLDQQRYKVQRLLEELKTVKSSNRVRINKMRKELETLRGIMRQYVMQIDSLSRANTELRAENKVVRQRYVEEQQRTTTLTEEKKALTSKVTLASILEAKNIVVETLNNKGRNTSKISKIAQLKFSFSISKNISAPTGEKYIYLRVLQPDETPLVKKNDNLFLFENKYINYSARRPIEYEGEEVSVTIYWDVEEFLHPGKYRADVFADGYIIGSSSFFLKK